MTKKEAFRKFESIVDGPVMEHEFRAALKREVKALDCFFHKSRLPIRREPKTKPELIKMALSGMIKWYRTGNDYRIPLRWKDIARHFSNKSATQIWCIALRKYHIGDCL